MKKYEIVINHLTEQIENGLFNPGDRLPSMREISERLDLSLNTVIRGFQALEADGLIEGVSRSGYIVCNGDKKSGKPSYQLQPQSVDLYHLSREVLAEASSTRLLPMGSAHPCTTTASIEKLYSEIAKQSRLQARSQSHYQIPPGELGLRKHIAQHAAKRRLVVAAEEITLTQGSQQGIVYALQALTQPGDIVMVESPCYFGSLLALESLRLRVVEIPGNPATGPDLNLVEQTLKQWPVKVILINPSFNNPSGYLMPMESRSKLLEISGDIPIIEDDIFGDLAYDKPLPSLKSLDTNGRVIYCSSLSKTLDSRLRVGWMAAGKYADEIERQLLIHNMGSVNLIQNALEGYFAGGYFRRHLEQMCQLYREKQMAFCEELQQLIQGAGKVHRPEGGFLCWVTLNPNINSYSVYQRALQQNISVLPGQLFSTQNHYDHCLRLNFAHYQDNPMWHHGLKTLATIIHELA